MSTTSQSSTSTVAAIPKVQQASTSGAQGSVAPKDPTARLAAMGVQAARADIARDISRRKSDIRSLAEQSKAPPQHRGGMPNTSQEDGLQQQEEPEVGDIEAEANDAADSQEDVRRL